MAPFLSAAEAIENDPRFPPLLLRFCQDIAAFHGAKHHAASLFADIGQFAIVAAIVASPAPATEAELIRAVNAGGLASRRRIRAQIARLEAAGMIMRGAGARDRPMSASSALEEALDGWVRANAGAAAAYAGLDTEVRTPGVGRSYLRQVMASHARGFSAFATLPTVSRLMTLARGHVLIADLLRTRLGTQSLEINFSRRRFSAQYGVSRSHAIDLLRECETLGLLSSADGNRVRLSPTFDAEMQRWGAISFALAAATLQGRLIEVIA